MSSVYRMPDLGDGEGEVIEWLVGEGEALAAEQPVLVVEADKATVEVPAPAAGVLLRRLAQVGDEVVAGVPLFEYEGEAAAPSAVEAEKSEKAKKPAKAPRAEAEPPPAAPPRPAPSLPAAALSGAALSGEGGRPVYAGPAVRQLARKLGVNLALVPPTGRRGRVAMEDVERWVASQLASGRAGPEPVAVPDMAQWGGVSRTSLSRTQRSIAGRMAQSWPQVPQVTQFDEADITELEQVRAKLAKRAEKEGVKLTPVPFLLRALTLALQEHELFRSLYDAASDELVVCDYCDLGLAVESPRGLLVPVLRGAQDLDLFGLARAAAQLAEQARSGRMAREQMAGGTFTLSSLGRSGGLGFSPLVSPPQLGILGVGRMRQGLALSAQGEVQPRSMLPLTLSYDHRVVNGAQGGAFLTRVAELLASPEQLQD